MLVHRTLLLPPPLLLPLRVPGIHKTGRELPPGSARICEDIFGYYFHLS